MSGSAYYALQNARFLFVQKIQILKTKIHLRFRSEVTDFHFQPCYEGKMINILAQKISTFYLKAFSKEAADKMIFFF